MEISATAWLLCVQTLVYTDELNNFQWKQIFFLFSSHTWQCDYAKAIGYALTNLSPKSSQIFQKINGLERVRNSEGASIQNARAQFISDFTSIMTMIQLNTQFQSSGRNGSLSIFFSVFSISSKVIFSLLLVIRWNKELLETLTR